MELEKERKDNARFFLIDFCGYQSKPRLLHKKQPYLTSTLADMCLKDNNMKNNSKGHHLTT